MIGNDIDPTFKSKSGTADFIRIPAIMSASDSEFGTKLQVFGPKRMIRPSIVLPETVISAGMRQVKRRPLVFVALLTVIAI